MRRLFMILTLLLTLPCFGANWFVATAANGGNAGNDGKQSVVLANDQTNIEWGAMGDGTTGYLTLTAPDSDSLAAASNGGIGHVIYLQEDGAGDVAWYTVTSFFGSDEWLLTFLSGTKQTGVLVDLPSTGPELTIGAALADASTGDTIYIGPGTFDTNAGVTGLTLGDAQDNETLTLTALDQTDMPILTNSNAAVQHVVYIPAAVDSAVLTFSYLSFERPADADNRATMQNESVTTGITLTHCTFDGANTAGVASSDCAIRMANVAAGGSARNLTVSDCTFDNYLRDVMIVQDTPILIVTGCTFDQPGAADGSDFAICYLPEEIGYVRIGGTAAGEPNTITRLGAALVKTATSGAYPTAIAGTDGVVEIIGNNIQAKAIVYSAMGAAKVNVHRAIDWRVRGNTFVRSTAGLDTLRWANNVPYVDTYLPGYIEITDNTISEATGLAAVHFLKVCAGSSGAEIARNKVYVNSGTTGSDAYPIVFKGPYGSIHHNDIYKPVDTGTPAIYLLSASRTKCFSNSIFVSAGRGIQIAEQGPMKNDGVTAQAHASGTCQAGSAAGTIVLAADAPAADTDYWTSGTMQIWITGGTGVGQMRYVTAYTAAADTITVDRNWDTTPDNTSEYMIGQQCDDIDIRDNLIVASGTGVYALYVIPTICRNWTFDYNAYYCMDSATLAALGGTTVTWAQGISGTGSTAARWLAWGPTTLARLNDAHSVKLNSNPLGLVSGTVATDSWTTRGMGRNLASFGGDIGATQRAGSAGLYVNPKPN